MGIQQRNMNDLFIVYYINVNEKSQNLSPSTDISRTGNKINNFFWALVHFIPGGYNSYLNLSARRVDKTEEGKNILSSLRGKIVPASLVNVRCPIIIPFSLKQIQSDSMSNYSFLSLTIFKQSRGRNPKSGSWIKWKFLRYK